MPAPARFLVALALVWLAVLSSARAQDPELATLVANSLAIAADERLVAEGNVEVFFRGVRLTATRITYDRKGDRLVIEGPIRIDDGSGTVVVADQADLTADLSEGILTSARLVFSQQLQVAATEVQRIGGRYTRMGRSVASSCQVCADNPTPLWEVRASSVIHDAQRQRLFFENATLRVIGVPVFYIPRLRIPEPGVERATGFLVPSLVNSTDLGTGVRLPYFVALGPHSDATFTPFLTNENGRTLGLRFRQALTHADLEFDMAVTRDELLPGETRGLVRAMGAVDLADGFKLDFNLAGVSDPAYLLDYDLSEQDRVISYLTLSRTRRDEFINANTVYYQTLRESEDNDTLPTPISEITYLRRFGLAEIGDAALLIQLYGAARASSLPVDLDADGIADGRDTQRATVDLDWRKDWILPQGLQASALAGLSGDLYWINQDGDYNGEYSRLQPTVAAELRWPFLRTTAGGASQTLEPVVQLVWSGQDDEGIPNEDSTLVEFDEGNLFSLDRFPGADAVETGTRLNLGVSWTHLSPAGWSLSATAGRVWRAEAQDDFGRASGLDGTVSDWLAMVQYARPGVAFTNRAVFEPDMTFTKVESRLDASGEDGSIAASYLWAVADEGENRPTPTSEIMLDGSYEISRRWSASFLGRYDLYADEPTRAGLGLVYRNECILVDLSLSRRYTSSSTVQPSTDFGVTVDLLGFGSTARAGPARTCGR